MGTEKKAGDLEEIQVLEGISESEEIDRRVEELMAPEEEGNGKKKKKKQKQKKKKDRDIITFINSIRSILNLSRWAERKTHFQRLLRKNVDGRKKEKSSL